MDASQIITLGIFAGSYILIFSGRVDRTVAALVGLAAMVSAGYALGFMDFENALEHVDWEVVLLLLGMMTYVGLMAKTGFFKYIGIKAIKLARGEPWLIFLYLSLITTLVSMIIDNVTTILLIIPITVEVAEMLKINPVPVILGETVLSNIGGVGTMIGDPPNIMIGMASGFTFNDFILHLFLPVMAALLVSVVFGRSIYAKWIKEKSTNWDKIMTIKESKYIRDERNMRYLLYLLFGMIFFFATEQWTGINPSFVALSGGAIALLISKEEPKEAFKAVEWTTLVFFIALFALVGGLEETGLLEKLARAMMQHSSNVVIIAILILWVSGLLSSFVDNIPITAAFIPVAATISGEYHTTLIWWALAMGVGMGGNITPIGSSAGVISVSLSKSYGHEITTREWLKYGTVTGIASMAVCTLFILMGAV